MTGPTENLYTGKHDPPYDKPFGYGAHKPGYRRYAKRVWRRFVRRLAKKDPENAPTKLRSKGWA